MKRLWTTLALSSYSIFAVTADHEIRLLRPLEPGHRCSFSGQAVLAENVTVSSENRVLDRRESGYAVDMKATREVIRVDGSGRATELAFTIHYCTKTRDNRMKELIPRGAVLRATFENGEERFSVDGEPTDAETTEALSILIVLADDGPTIDEVFGTDARQAVGGRWPVDPGPAARSFANSGIVVGEDAVSGEVGLAELSTVADQACLEIVGELAFSSLEVTLPSTFELIDGTLGYRFEGHYPRDPGLEPPRERKEMVLTLTTREKERPEVRIVSVTRQSAHIDKRPL